MRFVWSLCAFAIASTSLAGPVEAQAGAPESAYQDLSWRCVGPLRGGWATGLATFVGLPAVAVAGLYALEHWRDTIGTARRWITLRRRDPRVGTIRERQRELADRLDAALAALQTE